MFQFLEIEGPSNSTVDHEIGMHVLVIHVNLHLTEAATDSQAAALDVLDHVDVVILFRGEQLDVL